MYIGPDLTGSELLTIHIILAFVVLAIIVVGYCLSTFVLGAGYEPIPGKMLDEMIELSRPSKGQKVYDMGSGFGKIIIRVAQVTGASCTGIEVDPLKVWWTRRMIRSKGLQGSVSVMKENLMDADISQADIVYAFLWDGIMQKVGDKAIKEMKAGSLLVSYYHKILGWDPEREDAKNRIYLYRIPERTP